MKPPVSGAPVPGDKSLPAPDAKYVQLIRTYGPGRFQVSEREWREPVLVTDVQTVAWNARSVEDLEPGEGGHGVLRESVSPSSSIESVRLSSFAAALQTKEYCH